MLREQWRQPISATTEPRLKINKYRRKPSDSVLWYLACVCVIFAHSVYKFYSRFSLAYHTVADIGKFSIKKCILPTHYREFAKPYLYDIPTAMSVRRMLYICRSLLWFFWSKLTRHCRVTTDPVSCRETALRNSGLGSPAEGSRERDNATQGDYATGVIRTVSG